MVGKPGEIGIAEIQDIRFTVADILPGATIVQVNLAGAAQGDVGFWNSHITVGGSVDTKVNTACSSGDTRSCLAAFAMLHLTKTSSCYIENMWGWTADHSLERGGFQNIAAGRGALIEATQGTWLTVHRSNIIPSTTTTCETLKTFSQECSKVKQPIGRAQALNKTSLTHGLSWPATAIPISAGAQKRTSHVAWASRRTLMAA